MIQATFKQKNNRIYWFQVVGHANHAPLGQDIVCAGVSSLYIAVTNALLESGHTFERDGGYFILDGGQAEEVLTKLLRENIVLIAKEYPEHVRVQVI